MDSDPAATDKVYLARSHREGENCLLAYADCQFQHQDVIGEYAGRRVSTSAVGGKHIWSDASCRIAVDASNPLACTLRYAGDTLDLEFGNNAVVQYCPILDKALVYATRDIDKDEPIGITFGQEYWRAMEWDLPTLLRAQVAYAAQTDPLWNDLIRRKSKLMNIMLDEGEDQGDDESSSSTDDEEDEKKAAQIIHETGDWAKPYISLPRPTKGMGLEYDNLYGGDIGSSKD
jgi:hypothetical protein